MHGRTARPDTLRLVLIDPLVRLLLYTVWSNVIDTQVEHNE